MKIMALFFAFSLNLASSPIIKKVNSCSTQYKIESYKMRFNFIKDSQVSEVVASEDKKKWILKKTDSVCFKLYRIGNNGRYLNMDDYKYYGKNDTIFSLLWDGGEGPDKYDTIVLKVLKRVNN
jgi:hypothetical protein